MRQETSMFGRMCLLRDWLKDQYPKITEAAIERKMGVATNYFKTRLKAPISEGEKGMRPQTLQKVKTAWATMEPESPSLNMDWLETGEGDMFLDRKEVIESNKGIPYFDVDFLGGFDEMENDQTIYPSYYIELPPYNKKGVMCLNLVGDSMSPRINSGDKIFIQQVNHIDDIIFGEIYAIVTMSGLRTVKWVTRSPEPDMVRLIPENKDPRYGDYQDIRKSGIRRIFKASGAVRNF